MDSSFIDHLPDELFVLILNYVDLSDLFNNGKLVSKKWYSFISEMRFDELIVSRQFIYSNSWFHTYKSINLKNLIQCRKFDFFDFDSFRRNFLNLKYLKIYCYTDRSALDFERLNRFERLIHLELGYAGEESAKQNLCLRLPNLEILKIKNYFGQPDKLIIDCPRLNVLSCFDLDDVSIDQSTIASSIRHLEVKKFNHKLRKLVNLECLRWVNMSTELSCEFSSFTPRYKDQLFTFMPVGLKELHLNDEQIGDVFKLENDCRLCIGHFLKERIVQKRHHNLKIYLEDVRLSTYKPIDEYKFNARKYLTLFYENYEQLADRVPCYNQIDYDDLMQVFGEIPANFFRKFINIQKVRSKNTKNPMHFYWFISNLYNLNDLHLYTPGLGQAFYNRLPAIAPRLTHFYLAERIDLELKYDFVLRFKVLIKFETSQSLPLDLTLSVMKRSKFIQDLVLNDQEGTVTIVRNEINSAVEFYLKYDIHDYINDRWSTRTYEYSSLSFNELARICAEIEQNNRTRFS